MPLPQQTQADSLELEPDSESELDSDSEPAPKPGSSYITPAWASFQGVITHSTYWLQGKSEDTIFLNPYFKGTNSAHGYAIYCVHGTADGSFAFKKLVDRLLENRPEKTANWLPESVSTIHLLAFKGEVSGVSIDAYAEQLASEIIKNSDKNVILFGHSRGGIVAAQFAETLAEDLSITVHGVFAFCSPFAGSPLATFPLTTISESVAEMTPDSKFLKTLSASMTRTENGSQKYVYFVAGKDSLVSPESSFMKDSPNVTFMPNHGHLSILTSHKILKPIHHYLKKITKHQLAQTLSEELSVRTAYLALKAEIIALKYRYHVYSSEPKLKVLNELEALLSNIRDGSRSEHFSEATTVGDFIKMYLETKDPQTKLSRHDIIKQNLTPSFSSFWRVLPSRSQIFIETLINQYQKVPLPKVTATTPEQQACV